MATVNKELVLSPTHPQHRMRTVRMKVDRGTEEESKKRAGAGKKQSGHEIIISHPTISRGRYKGIWTKSIHIHLGSYYLK